MKRNSVQMGCNSVVRALTLFFDDGSSLRWNMDFSERGTLRVAVTERMCDLIWVQLPFCQCECCPLDVVSSPTCPVAEVLFAHAMDIADRKSTEEVLVHILEHDGRRTILEDVPLQNVVGELVRLAVFQAGCPIGRRLKPLMSRLRPFPRDKDVLDAFAFQFAFSERQAWGNGDEQLEHEEIMQRLHTVFGALSRRFERIGQGDVCVNAVVVVQSLSVLFSLSAPKLIRRVMSELTFGHKR